MLESSFTIAAVEREVGLSKEVLRVWERRYGFPMPARDPHGERMYPPEQVRRLRLIKRLLDQGHRPGRLLAATEAELEQAATGARGKRAGAAQAPAPQHLEQLIRLLASHDTAAFHAALQQCLAREGLRRLVLDTVAPLSTLVGEAWEQGRLQVFEEHLFTDLTVGLLRQAIASVPRGTQPRVLLTTLPNETHGLGLLMVEALLSLEGAQCLSLGTQTPIADIVQATQAYKADVVALSFSAAFPRRQVPRLLEQVRAALPASIPVWAGGAGVAALRPSEGVLALPALESAVAAMGQWRAGRA